MMKPFYTPLKINHYSSNELSARYIGKRELYKEIGYDIDHLSAQDPGYENTCAVRMSLALIKSGVSFGGRLKIKSGKFAGKSVEPGAKLLADQLMHSTRFGKPEIFSSNDAKSRLQGKKGVIFFWKIFGYGGGHIDLIESINTAQVCHSACYFASREIWFWSLH